MQFGTVITALMGLQNQMGAALGGVVGAILAVLIEGLNLASDSWNIFSQDYAALVKRVKKLEDAGTGTNGTIVRSLTSCLFDNMTVAEAQVLATAQFTNTSNVTATVRTYTANDTNIAKYHNIRILASGASGTGTIATMAFPTPIPTTRAPRVSASIQGMVAAGAAKPIGIVPTFDSLLRCSGYTVNCPIALASTDQIDLGISFDEKTV